MGGGGLHLTDLMKWCRQNGMSGLEFMAGIPGTVGGAVIMNAGAFGKEIGEKVKAIQCVVPGGKEVLMNRSKLEFSYRRLHVQEGSAIVNACLELRPSTPEKVVEKMGDFLKKRKETQPLDAPSAGSVFKNPPGDYAGRLIEKAGLKGEKLVAPWFPKNMPTTSLTRATPRQKTFCRSWSWCTSRSNEHPA